MIPVHTPLLTKAESWYVNEALDSGWISGEGPYVEQFEQRWAAYCDCKYGVAVNNGTAALYTAMEVLGVRGKEVILPSFTIISCAQAVLAAGGIPVLVDCDPLDWCMDLNQVMEKITDQTAAVMPVHIYGHPVDMLVLDGIVRRPNLQPIAIVEDAAEAHGAICRGQVVGGIGDVGCFSFYANKIVTTGEGGMLVTNDKGIAHRARSYRNLCFRQPRFEHLSLGNNYRMPNLSAAVGLGQLDNLHERLEIRRRIAERYNEELNATNLQLPVERTGFTNVYWMYGVVVDEKWGTAAQLAQKLEARGVQTRPFFVGMHQQPVFQQMHLFSGEKYPVTEWLSRQGLYLPSGFTLTDEQIKHVVRSVRDVLSRPA